MRQCGRVDVYSFGTIWLIGLEACHTGLHSRAYTSTIRAVDVYSFSTVFWQMHFRLTTHPPFPRALARKFFGRGDCAVYWASSGDERETFITCEG